MAKKVKHNEVHPDRRGMDLPNKVLTFKDVMDDITDALEGADGEYITKIHNLVCTGPIKYKEDSLWEELPKGIGSVGEWNDESKDCPACHSRNTKQIRGRICRCNECGKAFKKE